VRLEGIHHVTAITANAPGNVDFYGRVLGLRLVKKTVNQDDPTIFQLFYAAEAGSPGSELTFLEYPDARPGRPGAGMVHRVSFRVASAEALGFWEERLAGEGTESRHERGTLCFADPEGLGLELLVANTSDEPLVSQHAEIPADLALQGLAGVRAYGTDPAWSRAFLEATLGFAPQGDGWEVRGERRSARYIIDPTPSKPGVRGAGTGHHVAWASTIEEHNGWHERAARAGSRPTPVMDRFYFRSIYFREPSGVLFEIATIGPGVGVDEPLEPLGERLSLPPAYERDQAAAVAAGETISSARIQAITTCTRR